METFVGYEIQFSKDDSFKLIPGKVKVKTTSATPTTAIWKKILSTPGIPGGPVYWRVVGTRADKTIATSEPGSIFVDPPLTVGDPQLSHKSQSTLPPPTLSWENNCNTKFKAWFGNAYDFTTPGMKKKALSFSVKNPNEIGTFAKELTSAQWTGIRKLVGDEIGATIYWYVESWDILKRYEKTEVMTFDLSD